MELTAPLARELRALLINHRERIQAEIRECNRRLTSGLFTDVAVSRKISEDRRRLTVSDTNAGSWISELGKKIVEAERE